MGPRYTPLDTLSLHEICAPKDGPRNAMKIMWIRRLRNTWIGTVRFRPMYGTMREIDGLFFRYTL
jgi:hypothetical protein